MLLVFEADGIISPFHREKTKALRGDTPWLKAQSHAATERQAPESRPSLATHRRSLQTEWSELS